MAFDLYAITRENIRNMKPYSSARAEYSGDDATTIFLDANEQAVPFSGLPENINRYPKHERSLLQHQLAAIKGVQPGQVFLGNGSDEAIDLILRCFARPGIDEVIIFPPTFGMYGVSAAMNDLGVIRVPLDKDFLIDLQKTVDAATANTRVIFICSPNNPSGNLQTRETIAQLLEQVDALVVVDEAYVDFAPEESMIPLLKHYPHLIVLQTFSKAWGLAGARVGMAYASQEIVEVLNKVRFPYNLSTPDTQLALSALNRYAEYRMSVAETIENRKLMAAELTRLPGVVHIYPSAANFLLVKTSDGNGIYAFLRNNGIIVRNRSSEPGCEQCLRITIGTSWENKQLLDTWGRYEPGEAMTHNSGAAAAADTAVPTGKAALQSPSAVMQKDRTAVIRRTTAETHITVRINLDGRGRANILTGIGFLDHMLHQIARHGMFDLDIEAVGDLHIDPHHTLEDTAICLGQAFRAALGNKAGIERYGFALPMDDSQAMVLIDFGGRIFLKWQARFAATKTGEVPTTLYEHFFRSFAEAAAANLHVKAKGKDDHHKIEAIFKAFAKALRMAVTRNNSGILPSTKGTL